MLRPRCGSWRASGGDAEAAYEKNAIFSAWLMRRIGASGSLAAVTGFRSMPLAMIVEPSDTSTAGTGAAGTSAGGAGTAVNRCSAGTCAGCTETTDAAASRSQADCRADRADTTHTAATHQPLAKRRVLARAGLEHIGTCSRQHCGAGLCGTGRTKTCRPYAVYGDTRPDNWTTGLRRRHRY